MRDMRDFEPRDEASGRSVGKLIAGVVVVLIFLGGGFVLWRWKQSLQKPLVAPVVEPQPAAAPPVAPPAPKVSMADGDALLRQLGAQLSSAPRLAKWLSESDIVRRLVAAVNLISEGNSPRAVLGFLGPAGRFEVRRHKRRLFASPKTYARYDGVAGIVTSIDTAAAAKAYGQIKPYLDAAFSEIGRPNKTFDAILHEAITKLTSTPVPERPPELQEQRLVYVYVDPTLEALSDAQKHLLRMGPANARAIQGWLKKLDQALPKNPP